MKPVKTFPLLLMLGMIVAMVALDQLFPALRIGPAPHLWLGAPPGLAGLALLFASAGLFRRRGTTLHPYGESAVLVQDGLYRYSRNPMYLGMLLVLAGIAAGLGQLLAALLVPGFVAVVGRQNIRHEERMLQEQFGESYRRYCARVRRWL